MVLFAQLLAFARYRPVVTCCLLLTLVLAGSNYVLWQRRQAVTRRHEIVRQNGEFMLKAMSNRTRIDADLVALRDAIAQIEENLLNETSMEVNLGYFYRLERTNRVRLLTLNQLVAAPVTPEKPFKSVPFSMQVSGPYRASMGFLRALETGPRILRVRTCSFERTSAESTDLILDLTIDVLTKA
jgi:Tfp pilus assembly protein PilO